MPLNLGVRGLLVAGMPSVVRHSLPTFEAASWRTIRSLGTVYVRTIRRTIHSTDCRLLQNPAGSSSGSAIAVAAGFAPISIGTETFGSLMLPAGRAALYSLKPGRGLISTKGIVPISSFSDQPGPMTKNSKDLAALMDVITDPANIPAGGYASRVTGSWDGLKIGTLDPEIWTFPPVFRKVLDASMEKQLVSRWPLLIDELCHDTEPSTE